MGVYRHAARGPGEKLPCANTISGIMREFRDAGVLLPRQRPVSKVAPYEQGNPKQTYMLGPDGRREPTKRRFAVNRYWLRGEDFELPEPELPRYLQAAVVAKLAITPTEEAETFLAELDEIFASAKPREAPSWPAEPPKGGRGPPN
jgi:hypothetical protein